MELADFEAMANRLYECGCDDGTPISCDGKVTIGFGRESESWGHAIDSAMADIRKAGFTPGRLSVEELVANRTG